MKLHEYLTLSLAGLVLVGCQTPYGQPDPTATGALTGGMIGAGTGAIIGNFAGHNTAAGAAIGGVIGLLTGAIAGSTVEQHQREMLAQQNPVTLQRVDQGQPLGLADIKALAQAGVSSDVIISQIRVSQTIYRLTTADVLDLKSAGVGEPVIDFMINTPAAAAAAPPGSTVVVDQPVQPPPPVSEQVVVAPGPGYVWMGGAWTWYGNRWVWVGGRWAYPPHRYSVWVRGGWMRRPGGYVWMNGYWR